MIGDANTLRRAVRDRFLVDFKYSGQPRTVLPMAFGQAHNGTWKLRALQVAGGSISGHVGDNVPKFFDLDQMHSVTINAASFDVPNTYRTGDKGFAHIDCEL
jgi:hypothetical protein